MSTPCIFFDRDGIANVSPGPGYVERLEDFHIVPEFVEAVRMAYDRGYAAVLITNQRGVSLGRMTRETVDTLHQHLQAALVEAGVSLLDIQVCTADDNDDPRRKPNPGMILESAQKHDLDLSRSWMIGDREGDVVAGKRAGCRTVLVGPASKESVADYCVPDMQALVDFFAKSL